MFESLPFLYAAIAGGVVAAVTMQWLAKRASEERTRLLERSIADAKRLAALKTNNDAAEIAAREAREAVRLEELKNAVADLK